MKNTPSQWVVELNSASASHSIGGKASNLLRLKEGKFPIPRTWVIPWEVYQAYQEDQIELVGRLKSELTAVIHPQARYAVRSSADIEDGKSNSFAGQFKTALNVQGVDRVLTVVWSIWATATAGGVSQYAARKQTSINQVRMAVIIQEMVQPVYSGVAFSRNPMTGTSEIVIEAVAGEGTALVQDGVTPFRWVSQWGKWIAVPDESPIPLAVIEQVAGGTRQIGKKMKLSTDLEWVYDGKQVFWVQMREITALGEVKVYSNRISREVMPGIIKPLIWSINIPLVNTVWIRLLEQMVGHTGLKPQDLARSFYYRSYFNMGAIGKLLNRVGFPSEGVEMMMGVTGQKAGRPVFKPGLKTLRLLPRLLFFLADKWNFAGYYEKAYPESQRELGEFSAVPDPQLSESELTERIEQLYAAVQKAAYLNVVVPLLVSMYTRMLASQVKKGGYDMAQFNLGEGMDDLDEFNPNTHLRRLIQAFLALDDPLREQVRLANYAVFQSLSGIQGFQASVAQFLERFGHLSDSSNDFSAAPWREQPDLVLSLIRDYPQPNQPESKRPGLADLKLRGLRKIQAGLLYRRARQFMRFREQISALYIRGYGLFRPYLLALAKRLVERSVLETIDDIFFLEWSEVRAAADGAGSELKQKAAARRAEIERVRAVALPEIIYGDEAPPAASGALSRLSGTPTSRGYYTGPVCVVKGIQDFPKVRQGDVLVIPYSETGWAPLFARAGAVIAESGGLLSHSSIIAREYGIPAVVSVNGAMNLCERTRISIDGYTGEIIIHTDESTHAA